MTIEFYGLTNFRGNVLAEFRTVLSNGFVRMPHNPMYSFPASLAGYLASIERGTQCLIEIEEATEGPTAMRLVSCTVV